MVYQGVDTTLGRPVAIKMMLGLDQLGDDVDKDEIKERFLREAKAAAQIQSRSVAQVLQLGTSDEGEFYIVMELLKGQPLSKVMSRSLRAGGPMAPERVHIGRQICRGMQAAHDLGIVHRDLKPGNIMLVSEDGDDDTVKTASSAPTASPAKTASAAKARRHVQMTRPAARWTIAARIVSPSGIVSMTASSVPQLQSAPRIDVNTGAIHVAPRGRRATRTKNRCDVCLAASDCPGDGLFCSGEAVCNELGNCVEPGNPCTGGPRPRCNEGADRCDECRNSTQCADDGLFCTGTVSCDAGIGDCVQSGNPCSGLRPLCNEAVDRCDQCLASADCPDDGAFCTGSATCDAAGTCFESGAPCEGGPRPECNEDADRCDACVDESDCADDGLFCTGSASCDAASGDCVESGDPCAGGPLPICNESASRCDECLGDNDCAGDDQFCTGAASCDAGGACVESGDPCGSFEFCNEATDSCDECAFVSDCPDRPETCQVAIDCVGGACTYDDGCPLNQLCLGDGSCCPAGDPCDIP